MNKPPYQSDRQRAEARIDQVIRRTKLLPCIAALGIASIASADGFNNESSNTIMPFAVTAAVAGGLIFERRRAIKQCEQAVSDFSYSAQDILSNYHDLELGVDEDNNLTWSQAEPPVPAETKSRPAHYSGPEILSILPAFTSFSLGTEGSAAIQGILPSPGAALLFWGGLAIGSLCLNNRDASGTHTAAMTKVESIAHSGLSFKPPEEA